MATVSVFRKSYIEQSGTGSYRSSESGSGTATATPPPTRLVERSQDARPAHEKTPTGIRVLFHADVEPADAESQDVAVILPGGASRASGPVPTVAKTREQVQAETAARLAPGRWNRPEKTAEIVAQTGQALARATGAFPAVPAPAAQAPRPGSGAVQALTPRSAFPSGPAAGAEASAVTLLDAEHVEPLLNDDRDMYFCQDGTIRSADELREAGYALFNGLWYSLGEQERGLHQPLPPGATAKMTQVRMYVLGKKAPVQKTALQDSATGRVYTEAQWSAATSREKSAVAQAATRAFGRITGIFNGKH